MTDYSKMTCEDIADRIETDRVKSGDKPAKTEEEIWCDYREIMYNAWADKQKTK